jgi:hypothetical protein
MIMITIHSCPLMLPITRSGHAKTSINPTTTAATAPAQLLAVCICSLHLRCQLALQPQRRCLQLLDARVSSLHVAGKSLGGGLLIVLDGGARQAVRKRFKKASAIVSDDAILMTWACLVCAFSALFELRSGGTLHTQYGACRDSPHSIWSEACNGMECYVM